MHRNLISRLIQDTVPVPGGGEGVALGEVENKIASQRKTHTPRRFLYLRETKIWWCEGEEGEEKVHLQGVWVKIPKMFRIWF